MIDAESNAKTVDTCISYLQEQFHILDVIYCDTYKNNWVDLYLDIKKLYKESYSNNERIVFVIENEVYNNKSSYGLVLQSIQTICNDIDISNFFCTVLSTNPNLLAEYDRLFTDHSIDPVPMNIQRCTGSFSSEFNASHKPFMKIQNLQKNYQTISNLDEQEKKLLFEDKVFCIAPWTSMMISTDNKVRPCCEFKGSVGDTSKQSLSEAWNSSQLRQLRSKMILGEKHSGCSSCYKKEDYGRDSLRNSLNRRFAKHIDRLSKTDQTGYLQQFDLVYLDSRFNNLCNLSCRSCGHRHSSSWHKPATALGLIAKDTPIFLTGGRYKNDLFEQVVEHADSLESIYFAGGEPLIIKEFYDILAYLEKNKKHDVELIYNTNMTKAGLPDRSIFDAWKNFTNISIGGSLDAEGERAEYLRTGTKWQNVLNFRTQMIQQRPDINFYVSATTGLINALHVPDFHRSWVDQGFITPEQFNIQILFGPEYMRVDTAPPALKDKIRKKYLAHLDWLRPLDTLGRATYGFESILEQLQNDIQFDKKSFWKSVQSLDDYYKVKLLDVFPELEDLI